MKKQEEWKPIPGFINYEASSYGRIRSIKRVVCNSLGRKTLYGKILIGFNSGSKGYLSVNLIYYTRKFKTKRVHRLVAEAFIPNPDNKPQVNHINGIKTDNRVENLEWCTASENMKHAFNTGLRKYKYFHRKLSIDDVIKIKRLLKKGLTQHKIADMFNVSNSLIHSISKGHRWYKKNSEYKTIN